MSTKSLSEAQRESSDHSQYNRNRNMYILGKKKRVRSHACTQSRRESGEKNGGRGGDATKPLVM